MLHKLCFWQQQMDKWSTLRLKVAVFSQDSLVRMRPAGACGSLFAPNTTDFGQWQVAQQVYLHTPLRRTQGAGRWILARFGCGLWYDHFWNSTVFFVLLAPARRINIIAQKSAGVLWVASKVSSWGMVPDGRRSRPHRRTSWNESQVLRAWCPRV